MSDESGPSDSERQNSITLAGRLLRIAFGLCLGLLLVELSLLILDKPKFLRPHLENGRFSFTGRIIGGVPIYVNQRGGRVRFVYDGDPRGHMKPGAIVDHPCNASGFRGSPISKTRPLRSLRVMFLGDSFTFGEGVREKETFAQVSTGYLQKALPQLAGVSALNLGVGGYDLYQSAVVAQESLRLGVRADLAVLTLSLGDLQAPLFVPSPDGKGMRRKALPIERSAFAFSRGPPNRFPFQLRCAQLLWRLQAGARLSQMNAEYLHWLHSSANPWRSKNFAALNQLAAACKKRGVMLVVALCPELHQLQSYPYAQLHSEFASELATKTVPVLDLFPTFQGLRAADLWVHPQTSTPTKLAID